ncbi:MAG TPA: lysophospholipid acyltransferase family protein, partial [Myxococcota bacterium]|nr:lysophospholipid acyltransferase family protein [Myxococcota bacterium]
MEPGGAARQPAAAGVAADRRERLDRIAGVVVRTALRVFYREVEVVGLERVPRDAPLVVVANHGNSLIDPALLLAVLPRMPRFLAKHTLWSNPAVRPLLELAGALPVRRTQDGGGAAARNDETFARCYEELACGGCVAIFPEGISYHEPRLQPVKTGAARVALGAEARFGPLGLRVLPVGLEFEEKTRFRSRALAVVGEPLDPAPELALAARDEAAAVRALTDRVRQALEGVTVNADTWREAALLARAADLLATGPRLLPGLSAQAERFTLRRAVAAAQRRLAQRDPERARAAAALVERYDALLERHALRDDQVAARYPWRAVAAHLLDRLPLLAVQVPAALAGAALHVVPALCARLVGRFVAS